MTAFALPLVEPVRDHEAAPILERRLEQVRLGDRLRPRVDRRQPLVGVVGPFRDESPLLDVRDARCVVGDDDESIRRADIVLRDVVLDSR